MALSEIKLERFHLKRKRSSSSLSRKIFVFRTGCLEKGSLFFGVPAMAWFAFP